MIQLINTADLSGLSVSVAAFDSGTQTSDYGAVDDTDSPVFIPAGKYRVKVYNEGLTNITVNGDTVPPANEVEFLAFNNSATQKTDLTPEITITIPAGGEASYSWVGPSA